MCAPSVSASSGTTATIKSDGRKMRAEKTKRKIISAALGIVAEGQELTVAATARWADVCERSVFQHYRDIEGLQLAVRSEILMWLVKGMASIEINGETHEARALSALSWLESIFVRTSHEVRQIEWTFGYRPDPHSDSFSTEAELLFNDKLQSLIETILGKEVRELLGKIQPGRYAELRFILETQLNPKVLAPLLCSVSLDGVHHMVAGTINEYVRAAGPNRHKGP